MFVLGEDYKCLDACRDPADTRRGGRQHYDKCDPCDPCCDPCDPCCDPDDDWDWGSWLPILIIIFILCGGFGLFSGGCKDDCFGGGSGSWLLILLVIFLLFQSSDDKKGGFLGLF